MMPVPKHRFAIFRLSLAALLLPTIVRAQTTANLGLRFLSPLGLPADTAPPIVIMIGILNYLLTFVGIISVAVMLYAGFLWMVSFGNEDRLARAKRTMLSGIIGLVIMISSFAIVSFIMTTSNGLLTGTLQ